MMHWIYLIMAILIESLGLTFMKTANGLSKLLPSVGMFSCYITCLALLSLSIKKIDIGLAYAIWSGVGTALISLIGVYYFNEILTLQKILGLLIVVIGIFLLKY
ncbi:MAG: multidrug efflux SMR transporter [Bacteroides sp.]|nr:MAG: multidrug efflux SMR transporter [Bacteroides sp.]